MKESDSVPTPSQAPTPQAWIAVTDGELAILKEELSGETDVNAKEPMSGSTLLLTACFADQTEIARFLIERGADIELANNDGSTPLMTAVFMCHIKTVQLLLEKGAQINQKNKQGQTSLDMVASPWTPELEGVYKFVDSPIIKGIPRR